MGTSQPQCPGEDPQDSPGTFELAIEPEAEADFVEATAYYEVIEDGLGQRFHDAVKLKLARIQQNPFQYPAASTLHRKAVVDVFPYSIYYSVLKHQHVIAVLAIHHAKRHPKHWRQRKPSWRK